MNGAPLCSSTRWTWTSEATTAWESAIGTWFSTSCAWPQGFSSSGLMMNYGFTSSSYAFRWASAMFGCISATLLLFWRVGMNSLKVRRFMWSSSIDNEFAYYFLRLLILFGVGWHKDEKWTNDSKKCCSLKLFSYFWLIFFYYYCVIITKTSIMSLITE